MSARAPTPPRATPPDPANAYRGLAVAWRARADDVAPYNAGAAHAFRMAAEELEARVRQLADEELSLRDAAQASGYSERHLRELLRAGKLTNHGRKHAPRLKRGELPRRAPQRTAASGYDPAADALQLFGGRR